MTTNQNFESLKEPFVFSKDIMSDSGKFEKITSDEYQRRFFIDCNSEDIRKDVNIERINFSDNTPILSGASGDVGDIRISSYKNSRYIVIDRIVIFQQGNETDNGLIFTYYLKKFE